MGNINLISQRSSSFHQFYRFLYIRDIGLILKFCSHFTTTTKVAYQDLGDSLSQDKACNLTLPGSLSKYTEFIISQRRTPSIQV